jgi:hypothetical protein
MRSACICWLHVALLSLLWLTSDGTDRMMCVNYIVMQRLTRIQRMTSTVLLARSAACGAELACIELLAPSQTVSYTDRR